MYLALEAGLFETETTFFDYGCGQGGDIQRIALLGHPSPGWDPYYFPGSTPTPADVVNLGYVINVIESQAERSGGTTKSLGANPPSNKRTQPSLLKVQPGLKWRY